MEKVLYNYSVSFFHTRYLVAYKNLLKAIENLGIAEVYGVSYYADGSMSDQNYNFFLRHDTLHQEYLNQSKIFVPEVIFFY